MKELFLKHSKIEKNIIGAPMYPLSNPELVACVSNEGGMGIVQPLTLTYIEGYDFVEGLRYIKSLTSNPIGMNALIEKSSKKYQEKMKNWIELALDEGVMFYITSLGDPTWVVDMVHKKGGVVYHDVTDKKWAKIAKEAGVDGLIAVNNNAGGHLGDKDFITLYNELKEFNLPIVCAGGISTKEDYDKAMKVGYSAVMMGTRFIATHECKAKDSYKLAVVKANKKDIVLTKNITGVNVSVINTPYIQKLGLKPNKLLAWFLEHFKHIARTLLFLKSIVSLKSSMKNKKEFFQAGKSVEGIDKILSVKEVFKLFS